MRKLQMTLVYPNGKMETHSDLEWKDAIALAACQTNIFMMILTPQPDESIQHGEVQQAESQSL